MGGRTAKEAHGWVGVRKGRMTTSWLRGVEAAERGEEVVSFC